MEVLHHQIIKNCKKILDDEKYRELLLKQLRLLTPNIIVCCDSPGIIKDFVVKNLYPKAKKINSWIYFDEKTETWIIHSYHLSYTQYPCAKINEEELYSKLMENFQKALNQIEN